MCSNCEKKFHFLMSASYKRTYVGSTIKPERQQSSSFSKILKTHRRHYITRSPFEIIRITEQANTLGSAR